MYMRVKVILFNRYNRMKNNKQTNKQKVKKEKELQQISGYYKLHGLRSKVQTYRKKKNNKTKQNKRKKIPKK